MLSAVGMFVLAPYAVPILLNIHEGIAFAQAVRYLRMVSLFYIFCFTGNTFTGYYDGIGKVMLPFLGALGHITIRVILSWVLFPYLSLNAVAVATGIG